MSDEKRDAVRGKRNVGDDKRDEGLLELRTESLVLRFTDVYALASRKFNARNSVH